MHKLTPLTTPELAFFQGYVTAAAEMFLRGQLDATLEASSFEIRDSRSSAKEIIDAAYPDSSNPINYVTEESLQTMETNINEFLTVDRSFWGRNSVPNIIEANLRSGFWEHLSACFEWKNAHILAVGPDVPCVNIGPGFTYILYNKELTSCLVLVGNTTD